MTAVTTQTTGGSTVREVASPSVLAATAIVCWRGVLRTLRFPAIVVQSLFFPVFFLITFTGLYAAIVDLPGFPTSNIDNWYVPFMMVQGASFGGVGAGFSTTMDIDNGFFDRLLLMPGRWVAILLGTVAMAVIRALVTSVAVLVLGLAMGARFTGGPVGVLLLFVGVIGMAVLSASVALALAYKFRDQRITALFPILIFSVLFVSTAQVPLSVATGWLHTAARYNPMTNVLRLIRQAFLDEGVTWSGTWGGLVALAIGITLALLLAHRQLKRMPL